MYMKKYFSIILVILVLLHCTYTFNHYEIYDRREIIAFTEKIGEVIDAEECKQYNLFHGFEDFIEARFYTIAYGGYEVEIMTDKGKYIGVNRDKQAFLILKDYFYRYNTEHFDQKEFKEKWGVIDYDVMGFPITRYEISENYTADYSLGCGAGCFLGSLPIAALTFFVVGDIEWNRVEPKHATAAIFSSIGVIVTATVAGVLIGKANGYKRAVDGIKKARQPHMVE